MSKSSKKQRMTQRFNAVNEIVASGAIIITPAAAMPNKAMQTVSAGFGLFNHEFKKREKCVLALQGALSFAHLVILSILLSTDNNCKNKDALCSSMLILDLLYKSILALEMSYSEVNKDSNYEPSTPSSSSSSR